MKLVPMVYEHAAQLIGERPWTVSRSEDLLVAAHVEAFRLYHHAPVVVGIDIYNVEPEAYGAKVEEPVDAGVPCITTPLCTTLSDIAKLPVFDPCADGRLPLILNAGRRLKQAYPHADIRIPVSGPVAIAGNLLGLEHLLFALLDEPETAEKVFRHLVQGQLAWCREIIRQGLEVIVFDSAAAPPMLSPSLFRRAVLPVFGEMLQAMQRISGTRAPLIIGGDTATIVDDLFTLDTGYLICPAETDQPAFLAACAARPDLMVRINMRAGVIASPQQDVMHREIARLVAMASGLPHVCLGTGIIPYGTPKTNMANAEKYLQQLLKLPTD